MSTMDAAGGFEIRRFALALALALTVMAIALGTWVLGSGSDPAETERTPLVADVSAPSGAQPPRAVAPPPDDAG